MKIGMFNANDYGDLDTIDILTGASDMHIRMRTYTDGVRFACGLEHSPLLFKYINRHHFNGMLKHNYNSDAHTLYPTFFMDEAVPIITANTITLNNSAISGTMNTNEYVTSIDGTLDVRSNMYDYKFIPVYDGVQEELLENPILQATTSGLTPKKYDASATLSSERSAIKIEGKIDLELLNPRISALNVYRSTNNGTYFKIKSIYMGDNDPNQETQTFYGADDAFWFSGDNSPSTSALNSAELIEDGFRLATEDGQTDNDYQSTGYHMVETEDSGHLNQFNITVRSDDNISQEQYGAYQISKFNKKSEATEVIFANNGDAIGGSADGGWYFASATEKVDIIDGGTDIISTSITLADNDTATSSPFSTNFTTSNSGDGSYSPHLKFTGMNDTDMKRWRLGGSGGVSDTTDYIISGWIRADGWNSSAGNWRLFVSSSSGHNQKSAKGLQDIAMGQGGDQNQNIDKWRWFQYKITTASTTLYMYLYTGEPDNGTCDEAAIYVKGLSVRAPFSSYTFDDNLRGFCGKNIGISNTFKNLGFATGTLKGNSLQRVNDNANYPTKDYADRTIITDNLGPFIRTSKELPTIGSAEPASGSCFFGTSNYQFFSFGTGATAATDQYMLMDFYDTGLPDGARHPNDGITSLDVKFKYATMLNGRQFVANVKITGDEDTEEYPNFVMYSNPGAPDIIPTSNFIKLDDLQGGEIVGIETLMSDIVVFMTNGIFRINVPSADPTNWSLVEAHPNIGCLHDKGITKVPNGIFFLSQESVIFLDSSFQATPVSNAIRDDYQAITATTPTIMKTHFDVKYNKLYITKLVSTNTEFWIFDVFRQTWSTEKHTSVLYDEFSLDNNNNTILIESDTNSNIRRAVDTAQYQDKGSVAIDMIAKTGEQELTPYDKNAYIRRVNTNTNKGGGTELDLDVIAGTTVTKENHLDGAQSTRTSQRAQKVQVKISDDSAAENYVKEISRVDVEYE